MFANRKNLYNHQKKGSIQEVILSSQKNSFRGEKIRMTPKSHYEGNKFRPVHHLNAIDGAASARPHNNK